MIHVNELLNEAIKETTNLNTNEIFFVRDLFMGYKWNRIPHRDRLVLGIIFLNKVNSGEVDIQAIEKTTSNQQRYKKL